LKTSLAPAHDRANRVAKALPDGYQSVIAMSARMRKTRRSTRTPYNAATDFSPVALIAVLPLC